VVRVVALLAARMPAALVLLVVACGDGTPAPATPAQPPAVVVIPPATAPQPPATTPVTATTADAAPAPAPAPSTSPSIRDDPFRRASDDDAPAARLGDAAALGAARVPFASYLVAMHNRIHPLFADQALKRLESLPAGHPLNGNLGVVIEIVLARDTGKVVRLGVIKSSGETKFDIAAVDVVIRAAPYGKAPAAIASADGNVYVRWELHRDPFDACSTRNARPFILKSPP
jgi:TonB C terminal